MVIASTRCVCDSNPADDLLRRELVKRATTNGPPSM